MSTSTQVRRRVRVRLPGVAALLFASLALAADPAKVLRVASFDIDTLDPQQYSDEPSFQLVQALFEPAYEWDYLSRTPKLAPLTASAPESWRSPTFSPSSRSTTASKPITSRRNW